MVTRHCTLSTRVPISLEWLLLFLDERTTTVTMGSNCSVWTLLVSFQGSVIGIPSASYKTQRIRPDSSQQLDPASTYKPTLMTPSFTPAVSHRISQPVLRQCCMSLRRNKDGCNRIDLGLIRPKRNIYINRKSTNRGFRLTNSSSWHHPHVPSSNASSVLQEVFIDWEIFTAGQ